MSYERLSLLRGSRRRLVRNCKETANVEHAKDADAPD